LIPLLNRRLAAWLWLSLGASLVLGPPPVAAAPFKDLPLVCPQPDGTEVGLVGRLSGEAGWQQQSHALPAGASTLRWRYVKNNYGTAGQVRGWVDQVTFSPAVWLAPVFSAPRVTNGLFQVGVSGSPGARYVVLGSSNGADWVPAGTNMSPFTFGEAASNPLRLYRARSLP
jgi:hypothetical protein